MLLESVDSSRKKFLADNDKLTRLLKFQIANLNIYTIGARLNNIPNYCIVQYIVLGPIYTRVGCTIV